MYLGFLPGSSFMERTKKDSKFSKLKERRFYDVNSNIFYLHFFEG